MAGGKPIDKTSPVLPADSGLLAEGLTESQPESLPSLLPKQHEPVDPELTGLDAPNTANDASQADQDQSAPLRQSACTTRNQLPCSYWNFTLWQNNCPAGAFDMWDGLHTCLYLMVGLYNAFGKSTV